MVIRELDNGIAFEKSDSTATIQTMKEAKAAVIALTGGHHKEDMMSEERILDLLDAIRLKQNTDREAHGAYVAILGQMDRLAVKMKVEEDLKTALTTSRDETKDEEEKKNYSNQLAACEERIKTIQGEIGQLDTQARSEAGKFHKTSLPVIKPGAAAAADGTDPFKDPTLRDIAVRALLDHYGKTQDIWKHHKAPNTNGGAPNELIEAIITKLESSKTTPMSAEGRNIMLAALDAEMAAKRFNLNQAAWDKLVGERSDENKALAEAKGVVDTVVTKFKAIPKKKS